MIFLFPSDYFNPKKAVQWFDLDELIELDDSQLVSPNMLRRIISDLKQNRVYPLETLVEPD